VTTNADKLVPALPISPGPPRKRSATDSLFIRPSVKRCVSDDASLR
jgi:hypothetical protein